MSTQYVGIDFHRARSVFVRMDESGGVLGRAKVPNTVAAWSAEMAKAGQSPKAALEATYSWYWAADLLAEMGAQVHLAHPLGMKGFVHRRVKNDVVDATLLADLLRVGSLPEAWIAPGVDRQLRELVRHRHFLVRMRTSLKLSIRAVLAKQGLFPPVGCLWGPRGDTYLDGLELDFGFGQRLASLRRLVAEFTREVEEFDRLIHDSLKDDAGYRALLAIPGVGPVMAAVFRTEIGDIDRFASPDQLASWVGLTPRLRESDRTRHLGHISKQGSRLARWAAIEAVVRRRPTAKIAAAYHRIAARRGRNIARVAAARQLMSLVYYGLRDGRIRCLEPEAS